MIQLKKISKSYIGKYVKTDVLKDVELTVDEKEFIAIMGRSGTGKTTLLNILGCMDRFDEGNYLFHGIDVASLKDRQISEFRNKNIGFVFQSFHLIPELTSLDNIILPMGLGGAPRKVGRERAYELLRKVGLEDKALSHPAELSGGQQQRIAIARALANHPKLILADEPTGNLDEENGRQIMEYLKQINKEGITIIMVTHDAIVSRYADYILEMKNGRLYQQF